MTDRAVLPGLNGTKIWRPLGIPDDFTIAVKVAEVLYIFSWSYPATGAGFGQKVPAVTNTSDQWVSNLRTGHSGFFVYFRFI
jgi:hypothetical protein